MLTKLIEIRKMVVVGGVLVGKECERLNCVYMKCMFATTHMYTYCSTQTKHVMWILLQYERSHRVRNETHKAYSKASGFSMNGNRNGGEHPYHSSIALALYW